MLFMVVEHFRNGNPGPAYQRFRDRGRLAPEDHPDARGTFDLRHQDRVPVGDALELGEE